MQKYENREIAQDEDLVEVLLDFIIVSANLAKKISKTMKQRQIMEGGKSYEQNERIGNGHHRPPQGCRSY